MDKKQVRLAMIKRLKELNPYKKRALENSFTKTLFASKLWRDAKVIGITSSMPFEWDTRQIIEQAWRQEKTVVMPKCDALKSKLCFYEVNDFTDLEQGYKGILEPIVTSKVVIDPLKIELLFVPGLLFDKSGYRIGFGGGYYDRYLVSYPNNTISLFAKFQLVEQLEKEAHDIAVQYLLTEDGFENK